MMHRNTILNLAEKVNKMGEAEIGNIVAEKDFLKPELVARYLTIAECRDLYGLLKLKDYSGLRFEEDRNRIWVFAYLLNKAGIGVLPAI